MKQSIKMKLVALATIVAFGATSCTKVFDKHPHGDHNQTPEVTNKVIDVTLVSGSTYTFDATPYGDADDIIAITKEATNVEGSKLTATVNPYAGTYNYVANAAVASTDQVVMQVKEAPKANGSMCGSKDVTNITINFTITTTGTPTGKVIAK